MLLLCNSLALVANSASSIIRTMPPVTLTMMTTVEPIDEVEDENAFDVELDEIVGSLVGE